MPLRPRPYIPLLVASLMSAVGGFGDDQDSGMIRAREEDPESNSPTDSGQVDAGGPGASGEHRA
jgi:hypothetical protein